jgi:lysophospholipase L1-like esterase
MSGARQRNFVILFTLIAAACCGAQTKAPRAAYRPEPVADAGWIRKVAEQQHALTNQACKVCFLGDSLTEFWTNHGRAVWDAEFAPLKAINLGLTADRTEHVLNRIQRLDFRRANPKVIVLMMGTNNLGMQPPQKPDEPADVARAVETGVALLRKKLPQASILVLTIPPSGHEAASALRQRIQQTNALLAQAKWPDRVRLLPVYEAMVDERDRWREGFTLDGTHFDTTGYAKLAELIAPVVKEMLK